jgi:pyridoxamine 5'-phosphate oxidase
VDLAALRTEYGERGIDLDNVDRDPLAQFRSWLSDAEQAGLAEPNAMAVSTVAPDGAPSSRFVLLRGLDERGFAFYTNHASEKAVEIAGNAQVALLFGWLALQRQVRVSGRAERFDDAEADAYFASRPRGSQIGAWASPQSAVLADRAELERLVGELERRFDGVPVPRPPHWGGYRVRPAAIEFWQGRRSRLHDRLRYVAADGAWRIERLAP